MYSFISGKIVDKDTVFKRKIQYIFTDFLLRFDNIFTFAKTNVT